MTHSVKPKNLNLNASMMDSKELKPLQIEEFKSKLLRTIRIWAIVLFVCFTLVLISITLIPLFQIDLNKSPVLNNIVQVSQNLIIEILPTLFIFIFIEPLSQLFIDVDRSIRDNSRKEIIRQGLEPLDRRLEHLTYVLTSLNGFPEIKHLSCSYTDTDWESLLKDAISVDLSMFYSNTDWNLKNRRYFEMFIQRGGILNLYLPNYAEVSSKYMGDSHVPLNVSKKILETMRLFNEMRGSKKDRLHIKILQRGFNYMYARITKKDNSRIFIMSPYANNYSKSGSPVIILDESLIQPDMQNFIMNELRFLEDTSRTEPDFEKSKQIIWRQDRNRVFVSTGLTCPGGCKFCYIDSLVRTADSRMALGGSEIASLCSAICTDPRFEYGKQGTTIMLGAFNDPFQGDHFNASMQIIKFFAEYQNFVHISARYNIHKKLNTLFPSDQNVVINYSISSLSKEIELSNQKSRFTEAKELIERGYKVALFLRPVIHGVTIHEIDEIIELAKYAGIKVVTVGGLYVDERIIKNLKKFGIIQKNQNFEDKNFVLDDKSVLKKLQINDLELLEDKLRLAGFITFTSSDQRIEYYKKN